MSRIIKATPSQDFTVFLLFESGLVKLLDMKPYIEKGGVWAEIADWRIFSRVEVQEDLGGLVWPGEIDFCPDTAFKVSTTVPSALLRDLTVTYSPKVRAKTGVDEMV
jgi:hypothetical protein